MAPTSTPSAVPTPAPTRDTVSLEVYLQTETVDDSYATVEEYCADYYALRVDEIEEAVVADYVDALRSSSGTASDDASLVSIDARCSPNATTLANVTMSENLAAMFSIRFVAYASSLFSRDDGTTVNTVSLALNSFFEDKVESGAWASDRLAQTTESSWTADSRRRLEDSAAAQDFITPQSVVGVETAVVETLNPTSAPSLPRSSPPSTTPSRCPTSIAPSRCPTSASRVRNHASLANSASQSMST